MGEAGGTAPLDPREWNSMHNLLKNNMRSNVDHKEGGLRPLRPRSARLEASGEGA